MLYHQAFMMLFKYIPCDSHICLNMLQQNDYKTNHFSGDIKSNNFKLFYPSCNFLFNCNFLMQSYFVVKALHAHTQKSFILLLFKGKTPSVLLWSTLYSQHIIQCRSFHESFPLGLCSDIITNMQHTVSRLESIVSTTLCHHGESISHNLGLRGP